MILHIPKKSEIYEKVVKIINKEHYTINLNEIDNENAVICPFDNDMVCGKDKDGNIFIQKKTIVSKPFE